MAERLCLVTTVKTNCADSALQTTATFQPFPISFPPLLFNHLEDCQAVSFMSNFLVLHL